MDSIWTDVYCTHQTPLTPSPDLEVKIYKKE